MKFHASHRRASRDVPLALLCALLLAPAAVQAQLVQQDSGFDPYPVDAESRAGLSEKIEQHLLNVKHRLSRGDHAAALAEINQGLAIAPDHPLLLQYAAHIYGTREAYILAEDCWSRLSDMDPENGFYQTGLAGMYIRQGNLKVAIPFLEKALKIDPVNLPARFNLALIRMAERKPAEAGTLLRARTSVETGQLISWTAEERPVIIRLLGRPGFDALAALVLEGSVPARADRKEIQTSEKLRGPADHIYQATRAVEKEDWPAAIHALNQARLAGAVAPAVYQDMAIYAWMNGSREKARTLLESLMTRFPDHVSIVQTLGILCLKEGLDSDAVRHLKAAIAEEPGNAEALFALSCAYARTGEIARARILLERIQRLIKKHPGLQIDWAAAYAEAIRNNPKLHVQLEKIASQNNLPNPR